MRYIITNDVENREVEHDGPLPLQLPLGWRFGVTVMTEAGPSDTLERGSAQRDRKSVV